MTIDTKTLKEIASRMEEYPLKQMIFRLPEQIDRKDLFSKFDIILQFLGERESQRGVISA